LAFFGFGVRHAGKFTGGTTERQYLKTTPREWCRCKQPASNRREARPLLGQDAQHADETSEGKTDGHAVNQSKTDFLAARMNREQRPQKPALPFHMNNALRHQGIS
jgi:hypothetical protein